MGTLLGTPDLLLNTLIEPGEHLDNDTRLMRDYICTSYDAGHHTLSVTVGDMANNHTGTEYVDKETADYRGLDPAMCFNGGLVGSAALQRGLKGVNTSGASFVNTANKVVHAAHERLEVTSSDGAERFTGYLAHAVVTPELVKLTIVGDVTVWVNGAPLINPDRSLDEIVGRLLTDFAEKPDEWEQLVASFADHVQLDEVTKLTLLSGLHNQREQITDTSFTRQDAYLATSRVIIPWYMNHLQNTTNHPYSYGAIDGTVTPSSFIHEATIPAMEIDSLIIATDGSQPRDPKARIFSLDDLVARNPVYCERSAIDLGQSIKMIANLAYSAS
jgi:hypothetical protein